MHILREKVLPSHEIVGGKLSLFWTSRMYNHLLIFYVSGLFIPDVTSMDM